MVLALFDGVLMALSMLLCVTFHVARREVWVCCWRVVGREILEEGGVMPLMPSSTLVADCVRVSVDFV